MKLYAICLVKNEDDIIAECLEHAVKFCDKVIVIDNGSSDNTWEIVCSVARRHATVVPFERTQEPYRDSLRAIGYNAHRCELSDNDWWLVLDADEFLAEDPKPAAEQAMREGADLVRAWFMQFYFTDRDLQAWNKQPEDLSRPVSERRRYYSINWQEYRMFRNQRNQSWDSVNGPSYFPQHFRGVGRRRIVIRHYQFRDPGQIDRRLRLRHGQRSFAAHVKSPDWRSTVRRSTGLQYYQIEGKWQFSLSGYRYYYGKRAFYKVRGWYTGVVRRLRKVTSILQSRGSAGL